MSKDHEKLKKSEPAVARRYLWVIGLLTVSIVTIVMLWPGSKTNTPSATEPVNPTKEMKHAGQEKLTGRWQRSDGNYVIEIRSASSDGKLETIYFNPKPIHVGRAEWQQKNGKLIVIVELRDVNYPGSIYTLEFMETEDRLLGNYFQAVEGTNYEVEFVRGK